jgi:hypothetical protein
MLKNIARPLSIVCIALALSDCGTHRVYSQQDVFNESQISHDKYKGVTYVDGVTMGYSMPGELQHRHITTTIGADGEIVGSWIHYNESADGPHTMFVSAHDADSRALRVETLDRQRGTKELDPTEQVAVDLPANYLREHLHTGIDIQLEGRRGNVAIGFGTDYLGGYWAKVLTAQACVKAKTC